MKNNFTNIHTLQRNLKRAVLALAASLAVVVLASVSNVFAADPPTITGVVPSSAPNTGGDTLTITGTGFTSGALVSIAGVGAQGVTVQSDTLITATTPTSLSLGVVALRVTNTDNQYAESTFTYTAPGPSVTSIVPNSGPIAGGNSVTINGANLTGDATFVQVATNITSACGLTSEGTVYCWGINNRGQLGNGTTANSTIPIAVKTDGVLAGKKIVAISGGNEHILALDSNGKVYSWGSNVSYQLGNNGANTSSSIPVAVTDTGVLAGKTITKIAAGQDHSLALDNTGKVYSWGTNNQGRLGANMANGATAPSPVAVFTNGALNGKTIVDISASQHSIAVDSNGVVYTWGYNASGQLGNNTSNATTNYGVPIATTTASTPMAGKKIVAVAAGLNHSVAVDETGLVYTWGLNNAGQLGNNSAVTPVLTPVSVAATSTPMAGKKIVAISGGISHTLALADDGSLYGWGTNNNGQLGNGSNTQTRVPVAAANAYPITHMTATTNNTSACGVMIGDVYCWGNNGNGQSGDGSSTAHNTPSIPINRTNVAKSPVVESVSFGGITVPITSSTPSSVTAVAPAHAAGPVDVVLSGSHINNVTVANGYQYLEPPMITSITPSNGSIAGGETAYISGAHFNANTTVSFGANQASVTYINSTTLLVTVPASVNPGAVDVTVTDQIGQAATLDDGFIYRLPAPTVTSVSPGYAKMSGGATATITGSGFVSRSGGGSWYGVTVDGEPAQNVQFINSTTLRFTVPAHEPGTVSIVVGGEYSDDTTLQNAFTYLPEAYEFTNQPRTLMATEPGQFTIRMLDASEQPVTSTSNVVLSLSSDSQTGFFARALTGQDAGWDFDSVTIPAGQSEVTFYYRDATAGTPTITVSDPLNTSVSQQVTINSRYKMLVTGVSNPTQVGTPSSVTVQAVDYTGAPQADFRGTIHFTSNDGAATLPADYTFTATDRGRKTFVNGVTMGTIGIWDVTATDTTDAVITGTQEDVVVDAPASGTIARLKFITPTQSFPLDQTSGVISVQTQDVNGVPIPVENDTTVYVRTSSSTGQFSYDNGATWQNTPTALTIAAGSSYRNILYRDTTAGSYELKVSQQAANDFGWQVDTQAVTVGVGAPSKLGLDYTNGGAIGEWVPVEVTLTDASGNRVTSPDDLAVRVAAMNGAELSLAVDGQSPAGELTALIATGQQSVTVYVRTISEPDVMVTAADDRDVDEQDRYETASGVVRFGQALPTGLVFSSLPTQTTVRTATPIQVSVRDQYGNIVAVEQDTEISLASDSSDASFALTANGAWAAQQTVTIVEGASTATVYVRNMSVNDAVSIEATSSPLDPATGSIKVVAGAYAGKVQFATNTPTSVVAGENNLFTVELLDAYGNPTVASETVEIGFGSSRPEGATWDGVADLNPTGPGSGYTLSIPAGEGSVDVTYRNTVSGTVPVRAYDQARWERSCLQYEYANGPCALWSGWTNTSTDTQNVIVEADDPGIYVITSQPQTIVKNTASAPFTVQLQDQYGNAASFDSETPANLIAGDSQYGTFALSASGPFDAQQLLFGANQSSKTFYYRSSQPTPPEGSIIVVAGNNGLVAGTQFIRVIEGVASKAVLDTAGQTTAVAGDVIPITLKTQTDDGLDVIVLDDTTFTLSSTEGEFSLTETPFVPVASTTLPADTSQRQLFYRSTVAGPASLSASGQNIEPVDTELDILSSTFYKLEYSKVPLNQLVQVTKTSESMVATAYDEFGNVAIPDDSTDTDVALSSSKTAGEFMLDQGDWGATNTAILAGSSTTEPFYYRIGTLDDATGGLTDSSVLGLQTITAEAQNAEPAETELRIVGGLANRIVISSSEQSLRAGQVSAPITVQLQDTDGTPSVASADQTINLSSLNLDDDGDFLAPNGNDVFSLTPGGDPVTTVIVPAGQSTVQFYVMPQTAESHRIRVSSAVYGHTGGYLRMVSATQPLSVTAGEASKLAFTSTEQIVYPNKISGAIKIAVTDDYGNFTVNETSRTLNLQSSCGTGQFLASPTEDPVTSVPMSNGDSEVVVYYRDANASATPCVITVSANGLESATQNLIIREPVYAFAITSDPQTIIAGQTSASITVETRDRFGNTVAVEDPITVMFEASGENNTIAPLQRTIPTGSSSAQFTFRHDEAVTAATTFTLTAKDVTGTVVEGEQDITVTPGAITATNFSTSSFTAIVGDYHAITLQAFNAYGKRTVATANTTLNLATSAASGAFYQKVGDDYQPITTAVIENGLSETGTIYYRQTQTTRTQAGFNTPASLTAQRTGLTTASAQATITAKTLSFSTGNFSAQASAYTPIRATISSPLLDDLTVELVTTDVSGGFYQSQNDTNKVTSTVIPAGQTQSAQLYYRQTSQTGGDPATITARPGTSALSVWQGSVSASIYLNQFSQLVFITAPETLEQGESGTFTVEARDDLGNVVPFSDNGGYCLYIGSTSGSAQITASGNTNIGCNDTAGKKALYVGQYQTRATFTYKDTTTGASSLTIANTSGTGGIRETTDVTITDGITTKVAFADASYNLVRGDEVTVSIELLNAHDFAVNDIGQVAVTLVSDSTSGRFFNASSGSWVSALTVTVPAGQTSVSGIRYSDATTDNSTIIRASASGLTTGTATVNVGVGAIEGIVFKNSPASLERGQEGAFTVEFVDSFNNVAPATSNFCLYVSTSGLAGTITGSSAGSCTDVTLPNGVVAKAVYVTAGSTEASFTYSSTSTGVATLRASTLPTGGGVNASHDVEVVNGAPVRVGVVPSQNTLERGGVLTGRAVLYNAYDVEVPIDRDVTVRVGSDLSEGIFATSGSGPWQGSLDLTIASGASSANFLYQSGDQYLGEVELSAATPFEQVLTSGTAVIEVVMGEVAQLVFATPELTTTATHPSEVITVQARNQYGVEAVVANDLQLYPRSSSGTGVFATSSTGPWGISSTKILAGQSQVSFYYQDETVGTHTITVRDKLSPQEGEEYLIATQQHHIVAQVFSHFIVTNISSPTRTGVASSAVVFAVDSENYVVAGYDGTVTFSSDDPTAVLPAQSYTFQPETDRGIHTFNNSIAFKTTGIKSVTVTDQNGKQGTQFNIEVTAGNSAPVRAIEFTNAETISVDKSAASEVLRVQLRDELGAITNAPVGGMPLRLTSNSATGEFSTDQTNWSREITVSVEAGLSFSTTPMYYRDSTGGTHTVTASDWIASIDNPLITNATLSVTVRDIAVDVTQRIYSQDYKGNNVENPYLFSRNSRGEARGYTTLSGTARDNATGDEVISNWNIQIGTISGSQNSTARLSYQSPTLNPVAGDDDYAVDVSVSSGSLTSGWQGVVPVSPWRATISNMQIDDTLVSGRLTTLRSGQLQDSAQAIIKVEGGVNQVTRTWNLSDLLVSGLAQQVERGVVTFRVPARLFAGGNYSVSAQLSDGYGITAEDVTQFTTVTPTTPEVPGIPGDGGSGTISPETPGDTSTRPEPTQPSPPRDGAYEQTESGFLSSILKSPETPIRVAQSMLGVLIAIVVVLAYQMYREWRHARFLLAVIRRDNATLANKDAFLQLASHHLRTPLTLLSSSSELLNMNPSMAVKQINQQLAGVVTGLKAKAEDILARTSTSEEVAMVATTPDEKSARRNVYRSPVFWVPVILTIVLTVTANWAVQTFGGQTIAANTVASQVALLLLGGILLYTAARLLVQRRQQSQALEQSRAKVKALNDVKVHFARQVGRDLTDDILHVNAYIQQLAPMTDATSQNLLKEGVERLERLVSRFTLLNSVYANTTQQDTVDMEKTVDEALHMAQQQNPAVTVSMHGSTEPITTRHARWMVSRLLQDVFTSMAPLAGSGVIKVNSQQTKDTTTLTITGPSSHDAPAEDLFSVYSRADEELAGTYSTEDADNRMHRLDLYLDRMIADELQAELSAKRVGGRMQVTVALPNA